MLLKDILELCSGSVVELDRRVEEPVDLLIDDRLIAQGEVVIVGGNYGLRVLQVATQTKKSLACRSSARPRRYRARRRPMYQLTERNGNVPSHGSNSSPAALTPNAPPAQLDRCAAPSLRILVQRKTVVLQPALSAKNRLRIICWNISFADRRPAPVRTTMPMGLMMLSRSIISDPQLRDAIHLQRSSGEKIGACLQHLGFVSFEDIASVVATQWGCPVFPGESVEPGCSMLVPLSLSERYRMVPVHLVSQGRRLFVGFCDKVNHTALIASSTCWAAIPRPASFPNPNFSNSSTTASATPPARSPCAVLPAPRETARMILSYAQQTGAEAVRLRP